MHSQVLSLSPAFIVEFKVGGSGRPAKAYVMDGMMRFVDGKYGPHSLEGAMWAFFRPGSTEQASDIAAIIDENCVMLRSEKEGGESVIAPSKIAPGTAAFDSLHSRDPDHPTIRLSHIFVDIAPYP